MGNVVCVLLRMWCQHRCSARAVASRLAFYPPQPPFYRVDDPDSPSPAWIVDGFSPDPSKYVINVQFVRIRDQHRIACFVFRVARARFTLLYSHGNATDCGAMAPHFAALATALRVNVVAYDYCGYGASTGAPAARRRRPAPPEPSHRAHRYAHRPLCVPLRRCRLRSRRGPGPLRGPVRAARHLRPEQFATPRLAPPAQLIAADRRRPCAVGSGPSCYLASRRRVAGLVLHSPFTSGMRVLTDSRALACFDIFPNLDRMREMRCPVFILHGAPHPTAPARVPSTHARPISRPQAKTTRRCPACTGSASSRPALWSCARSLGGSPRRSTTTSLSPPRGSTSNACAPSSTPSSGDGRPRTCPRLFMYSPASSRPECDRICYFASPPLPTPRRSMRCRTLAPAARAWAPSRTRESLGRFLPARGVATRALGLRGAQSTLRRYGPLVLMQAT